MYLQEVWGWGCYKDKEGKKFFNPSKTGSFLIVGEARGSKWYVHEAANPLKDIKKQQDLPILIQGLPSNVVDIACGAVFNLVLAVIRIMHIC